MIEGGQVLIVDDDPRNISRIEQALASLALQIASAENGEQALVELDGLSGPYGFPGIVLTDLKMPVMDGQEVVERSREIDAELPVIMITSYGDVTSAVRAMKTGAHDFIERPFDAELLRAKVTRALDKRGLVIENRRLKAELANRRLAAILAVDIVGYSRTWSAMRRARLLPYRCSVMKPSIP